MCLKNKLFFFLYIGDSKVQKNTAVFKAEHSEKDLEPNQNLCTFSYEDQEVLWFKGHKTVSFLLSSLHPDFVSKSSEASYHIIKKFHCLLSDMSNFHPDIGLLIFVTSNKTFRKNEKKNCKRHSVLAKRTTYHYENISFMIT